MQAPDFAPTFVKPSTWCSIGSGVKHPSVPHFADIDAFMEVFAHGEVNNPGGAAAMVAHSVADSLEQDPMSDVSPIIQMGIVRATTHEIKALRREHHGAWTIAQEEQIRTEGSLIANWKDFRVVAADAGLDAQAAVT